MVILSVLREPDTTIGFVVVFFVDGGMGGRGGREYTNFIPVRGVIFVYPRFHRGFRVGWTFFGGEI